MTPDPDLRVKLETDFAETPAENVEAIYVTSRSHPRHADPVPARRSSDRTRPANISPPPLDLDFRGRFRLSMDRPALRAVVAVVAIVCLSLYALGEVVGRLWPS